MIMLFTCVLEVILELKSSFSFKVGMDKSFNPRYMFSDFEIPPCARPLPGPQVFPNASFF